MSLSAGKKRLLEELLGGKKLLLGYNVSLGAGKKRLLEELLGGKKLLLKGRTQVVQVGRKKRLRGCAQVEFEHLLAFSCFSWPAYKGGEGWGSSRELCG